MKAWIRTFRIGPTKTRMHIGYWARRASYCFLFLKVRLGLGYVSVFFFLELPGLIWAEPVIASHCHMCVCPAR